MTRAKQAKQPNGFILWEDSTIVVIATGIHRVSDNVKTGPMIQTYVLRRDMSPVAAIKSGADSAICLDCVHRGTKGFSERSCYVNMNGPGAVYRAYKRGDYPYLPLADYPEVFTGRAVRLGTYGEPVLIPLHIVRAICVLTPRHSGYTHQWGRVDGEYLQYLMASCDRPGDAERARDMGYRTFRVTDVAADTGTEVVCPSESRGRHCVDCKLCIGAVSGAKSVVISLHGAGKKNLAVKLDRLIQIGQVA